MTTEELNSIMELIKSNEIALAAQLWTGLGKNLEDLVPYIF